MTAAGQLHPSAVTHQPDAYVLPSRLILGVWQVSQADRHITVVATFISKCGPPHFEMSIDVVRAFVQLRGLLSSNKELAKRLNQLEARIEKKLATHDEAIAAMLSAIRELMNPPPPRRRGIGFTADIEEKL